MWSEKFKDKLFFLVYVTFGMMEYSSAYAVNNYDTLLNMVAFTKIGEYEGTNDNGESYKKSYHLSRQFKLHWIEAMGACKSFGMELVSFETQRETDDMLRKFEENINLFEVFTHIDGISPDERTTTNWYFSNTGKHLNFKLEFKPGEPNNAFGGERCLSLMKHGKRLLFNDMHCYDVIKSRFICEKYIKTPNSRKQSPQQMTSVTLQNELTKALKTVKKITDDISLTQKQLIERVEKIDEKLNSKISVEELAAMKRTIRQEIKIVETKIKETAQITESNSRTSPLEEVSHDFNKRININEKNLKSLTRRVENVREQCESAVFENADKISTLSNTFKKKWENVKKIEDISQEIKDYLEASLDAIKKDLNKKSIENLLNFKKLNETVENAKDQFKTETSDLTLKLNTLGKTIKNELLKNIEKKCEEISQEIEADMKKSLDTTKKDLNKKIAENLFNLNILNENVENVKNQFEIGSFETKKALGIFNTTLQHDMIKMEDEISIAKKLIVNVTSSQIQFEDQFNRKNSENKENLENLKISVEKMGQQSSTNTSELAKEVATLKNSLQQKIENVDNKCKETAQNTEGNLRTSIGEVKADLNKRIDEEKETMNTLEERIGDCDNKFKTETSGLNQKFSIIQNNIQSEIEHVKKKIEEDTEKTESNMRKSLDEISNLNKKINDNKESIKSANELVDNMGKQIHNKTSEVAETIRTLNDTLQQKMKEVEEESKAIAQQSFINITTSQNHLREELNRKIDEQYQQ